jgi:ribulose-phosphate 3-epimerase
MTIFHRKNTYSKIEKFKNLIIRKDATIIIEADGGVTNKNLEQLNTLL